MTHFLGLFIWFLAGTFAWFAFVSPRRREKRRRAAAPWVHLRHMRVRMTLPEVRQWRRWQRDQALVTEV